jgi:hypothetical protein
MALQGIRCKRQARCITGVYECQGLAAAAGARAGGGVIVGEKRGDQKGIAVGVGERDERKKMRASGIILSRKIGRHEIECSFGRWHPSTF